MTARRHRQTEAERLRQHNEEMKLALAENVTVLEARRRLSARRMREFEAALERLQRCGTEVRLDPPMLEPAPAHLAAAAPQDRRFWWERD